MILVLDKEKIKKYSGNIILYKFMNNYIVSNAEYTELSFMEIDKDDTLNKNIMVNADYIKKLWCFNKKDKLVFELDEENLKLMIEHDNTIEKINYYNNKIIPDFFINIFTNLNDKRFTFENILTVKNELEKGYIVIDENMKFHFNIDSDNNYIYKDLPKDSVDVFCTKGKLTESRIFEYDKSSTHFYFYLRKDKEYLGINENSIKVIEYNSNIHNHYQNFKYILNKLTEVEEEDKSFILNYNFDIDKSIIQKILSILNDKHYTNNKTYITLTGKTLSIYDSLNDTDIFKCNYECDIKTERVDIPYKLYKGILKYKPENINEVYKYNKYFLIILKDKNKILINI